MSDVVYPITGGMEDWAYSGSWEGIPIITQPCTPNTYNGYNKEKTLYDKNYKDALRSIMFLLEISNEKIPKEKELGIRDDNCLLNFRSSINNQTCDDGYVNRVIRIAITLIDLLIPYIKIEKEILNSVEWNVGGAIIVDETFIIYDYFDSKPSFSNDITNPSNMYEILKRKSEVFSGNALWSLEFNRENAYKYSFTTEKKYLVYIIYAKVDKDWMKQNNPKPLVNPQTHIVNLRNSNEYIAKNKNFFLKGQEYFNSGIIIKEI